MNMNIRRIWVLILLGAFVAAVSGCNTVKGVGKDTEKAGEAIQREAEDARNLGLGLLTNGSRANFRSTGLPVYRSTGRRSNAARIICKFAATNPSLEWP